MIKLLLSCEHGGNEVPSPYAPLFETPLAKQALASHRGWDLGALDVFEKLKPLSDVAYFATVSRLLIDLNRSLDNAQAFSEYVKGLSATEKQIIIDQYYQPYRQQVEDQVKTWIDAGYSVWHISVHSFTPIWDGKERNADIGILFDPSRVAEKALALTWKALLKGKDWQVRSNYPYLGIADGLPTYLRQVFPRNYVGIELEINQKYASPQYMDVHMSEALLETYYQMIQAGKDLNGIFS